MGRLGRLQQLISGAGMLAAAFLLIRFAVDFGPSVRWWLATPFWVLVAAGLGVGAVNLFAASPGEYSSTTRRTSQALLLAAVPIGLFASSLDCSGLALAGCSPLCSFIKLVWIPLTGVGCAAYYLTRMKPMLMVMTLMSFLPLAPHCVCYNVANAWWIDRIGASPECYVWGFVVSMISLTALARGVRPWPSVAVCWTIIGGALAFFVTHHYVRFPW